MTTAFEFAAFYSSKHWQIFPVKPHDKTPLVKWQDEATDDTFRIGEWFTSKYPNANIGLACGKRSGLFALDVDSGHGGIETLANLTKKHGELPMTPKSKTGGGGYHYFFRMPEMEIRNSAGKLGNGLDIRANGGYVVAPLSIHPNGHEYKWETQPSRTELAPAPNWLLELLTEQKQTVVKPEGDGALIAGHRNNALTSIAGTLRRRGLSDDEIFVSLNTVNLNRCIPPLHEDEVREIAKSVSRYAPQDAPHYQSRDRVTAEWSFCKTIYEVPEYYQDFQNIQPDNFADKRLREYWQDVLHGMGVAQAAANAEILTELEQYREWALPRIDDYAKTILHYSKMARVSSYGWVLQKAAEEGDYQKIDRTVNELNSIPAQTGHVIESITDVADEVEKQIRERAKNPVEVWGIPYAWQRLSKHTGGKQPGELTLLAGEPKIGKSYWKLQDILETAVRHEVPCFYWCGEMPKAQLMKRFYTLLGVNSRNMKTGSMTEQDWERLDEAKALILNSPLYIDDRSLSLYEIRPMLTRMKAEYGIQEFVIDYASKVIAPGKDEIEQSNNISRELKQICIDLQLAGTMIASVNKQGMDNRGVVAKSNVRGSGQQIHDADVIFQLTTFPESHGMEYGIAPIDYPRCVALNITAGRELESILEGGFIPYRRVMNGTKFEELNKKG